jgi:hypothetical protein
MGMMVWIWLLCCQSEWIWDAYLSSVSPVDRSWLRRRLEWNNELLQWTVLLPQWTRHQYITLSSSREYPQRLIPSSWSPLTKEQRDWIKCVCHIQTYAYYASRLIKLDYYRYQRMSNTWRRLIHDIITSSSPPSSSSSSSSTSATSVKEEKGMSKRQHRRHQFRTYSPPCDVLVNQCGIAWSTEPHWSYSSSSFISSSSSSTKMKKRNDKRDGSYRRTLPNERYSRRPSLLTTPLPSLPLLSKLPPLKQCDDYRALCEMEANISKELAKKYGPPSLWVYHFVHISSLLITGYHY